MSPKESKLFVISGPSGAGKGTLVSRVRELHPDLGLTVSATTREPRSGEIDGANYYFLSDDEFTRHIEAGDFLEWANVHDHRYGTLASEVDRNLAGGHSLILEIDVQGALNVKKRFPGAVLIFIAPPSMEELRRRLVTRGSETPESLELRMADAAHELTFEGKYDEVVVNDDLERSTRELLELLNHYERI